MLAMVGPREAGRKYWSRFKVPLELFEDGVLRILKSGEASIRLRLRRPRKPTRTQRT